MAKFYLVVAVVFGLAGGVIWLAFLRPVAEQVRAGTILAKRFRPAESYSQQQPGISRGMRTATEIPIAEHDVLEIAGNQHPLFGLVELALNARDLKPRAFNECFYSKAPCETQGVHREHRSGSAGDRGPLLDDHDQHVAIHVDAHILEQAQVEQRADGSGAAFVVIGVAHLKRQRSEDGAGFNALQSFDADVAHREGLYGPGGGGGQRARNQSDHAAHTKATV